MEDIGERLRLVRTKTGLSQRQLAKKAGVSIYKVERGAREMLDKNGGFYKILGKK